MGITRTRRYISVHQQIDTRATHYQLITVDFDYRCPLLGGINRGRRKKREKKRENLKIRHRSPSTILIRRPWGEEASARLHGENKLWRLNDVSSLYVGRRNDVSSPRVGFSSRLREDVSSPCAGFSGRRRFFSPRGEKE
ncbi:hypothetical protein B296_00032547 [Ensete ventricosum]|uniref:Uncharacterized protein n=1 Tax=Ensete ventricosum TaxID=4639 RepID=A0A427ADH1_ENSVE|nr:hypothetical protein B296_00032547 [Ensete ventricosum]